MSYACPLRAVRQILTHIRVVTENLQSDGIQFTRETLEQRLKLVVRLGRELLHGFVNDSQSAALTEFDNVLAGNEVAAARDQQRGRLFALRSHGRSRDQRQQRKKDRDLHLDKCKWKQEM